MIGILPVKPVRVPNLRPNHVIGAAAQNFAGIDQRHFIGIDLGVVSHLLRQIFVHGLVVQIHLRQGENGGNSPGHSQNAQGAQHDRDELEDNMIFHF